MSSLMYMHWNSQATFNFFLHGSLVCVTWSHAWQASLLPLVFPLWHNTVLWILMVLLLYPKCADIWIVTSPSQFALVPGRNALWARTPSLHEAGIWLLQLQNTLLFGTLVGLPGKEHTGSGILTEVSWPFLCALLPWPQTLKPETKWQPKMLVTPTTLGCQHWQSYLSK